MRSRYFLLGLIALSLACGGGGDESAAVVPGGGGGSTVSLGFTPDQPNPGGDTVSASLESSAGDTVTVAVDVTDTNNLYGAAFDVVFDAAVVQFVSFVPGNALESGGQAVNYVVDEPVRREYADLLAPLEIQFEPHVEFKKRVPQAVGLIRTADTTQYGNIILESA